MEGTCFNCKQKGKVKLALYQSPDLIEWKLEFCEKCLKELLWCLQPDEDCEY